MNLSKIYKKFLENQDKEAEKFLFYELYKNTYQWFQNGKPENEFLSSFLELILEYEEPTEEKTLLDLGILELMDAVNIYNNLETHNTQQELEKHLKHSLMSFLAWIDEPSYRNLKNIEFLEIDFYIFEIIGGELPHVAIQKYLKTTKEIDVWIVIKYLEEILEKETLLEIIESLLKNYETLLEKYILLTYYIYRFFEEENHLFNIDSNYSISLPKEISYKEMNLIYSICKDLLQNGRLDPDFFVKIKNPEYESGVLIALLTLFEILNPQIECSWIEVFERSICNLWTCHLKKTRDYKKHQPIPEIAADILFFLPEEQQRNLLLTSKILILFFENINRYSPYTFTELADLLSIQSDLFEEELKFQLKYFKPKNLKRYSKCAFKINKKIIKKGDSFQLVDIKD